MALLRMRHFPLSFVNADSTKPPIGHCRQNGSREKNFCKTVF